MKVLIACEFSGIVRDAFAARGHDAWSCDLEPSEREGNHVQDDIRPILEQEWDLIIAHPPCTYLAVTANKWLKDQPARQSGALVGEARRTAREYAIAFFMLFATHNCVRTAIENPIGCMSTVWRKPDQVIQPFQFGHSEPKKTCLWLKGLPKLYPTHMVEPDYMTSKSGKRLPRWYHMPSPSLERQKDRNRTFQGIAEAMAEQWG